MLPPSGDFTLRREMAMREEWNCSTQGGSQGGNPVNIKERRTCTLRRDANPETYCSSDYLWPVIDHCKTIHCKNACHASMFRIYCLYRSLCESLDSFVVTVKKVTTSGSCPSPEGVRVHRSDPVTEFDEDVPSRYNFYNPLSCSKNFSPLPSLTSELKYGQ